jgi:hypothetical protein
MSRLRMLQVWIATVVLSTGLAVMPGMAEGSTQTFTGKVSDAMCGAKHTEAGIAPADCVCACVQKGAKYALVIATRCTPSTRLMKPRWTNSTSWLGNRPKLQAQPAEILFQ